MNKPLIGITSDYEPKSASSNRWHYFINQPYLDAVERAGAVPVIIPACPHFTDRYLEMIDGLLISGGGRHVNPAEYGEGPLEGLEIICKKRFMSEKKLFKAAMKMKRNMPILAICGGMQLVNVVMGGSLHQKIDSSHQQSEPSSETTHNVTLTDGLLSEILSKTNLAANSHHSQAVKTVGEGMRVTGRSDDGLIEVIEPVATGGDPDKDSFLLGIQWHPETLQQPESGLIFSRFTDCARQKMKGRAIR